MNTVQTSNVVDLELGCANSAESVQAQASAVSWGAILAGGAAAAALSLILLMLGVGLGLSAVSPWAYTGVTATTLGVSTILWLTFTQIAASGMGGYLAGRLRSKWIAVHTDEVYFRDTAHGFLAWAVASLATAALLTSVMGSIINGGIQAGSAAGKTDGAVLAGAELIKPDSSLEPSAYYMDLLFRKDLSISATASGLITSDFTQKDSLRSNAVGLVPEVNRIFLNTVRTGPLSAEDILYVSQVVAHQTGIPQQLAKQRVLDTYARLQARLLDSESTAKAAAEKGRKASAYVTLWLFISLLMGAFVASFAATYGGRQRDL